MVRGARRGLTAVLSLLACLLVVVPLSTPAAGVGPDVLSWSSWHRCYFAAPTHWEEWRVHIDRIGDTAKEYQVQIRGTEPVDSAEIYESRDGVFYYSGGYAGPASANWTSPVTQLVYLKPGKASRWAWLRLHRTQGLTLFQYCASHLSM
jgi:hypothetical protein